QDEYKIFLPDEYYWLNNFLISLLKEPIYYNNKLLEPFSYEHLIAIIEQFEIIKNSNLKWNLFISVVGGDIRDIKIISK
ncbi:MAG: hypothetical protein ACO2O6_01995, partial [Candidatus Hydrothermia bacterium]